MVARLFALVFLSSLIWAAEGSVSTPETLSSYVLGADDSIFVTVFGSEDFVGKTPYQIDGNGEVSLPLVGRIAASGATVKVLEQRVTDALHQYLLNPRVSVTVAEFRSQPVSVIGAVNTPGVVQLRGHKRLMEVLSLAGGLRNDAGSDVKITRQIERGKLELLGATTDPTGKFSVGQANLDDIMDGRSPESNILIEPNDIITVSKAELIYVIGEVNKAGGFTLGPHEGMSVLQAMSMAGGMTRTAGGKNAKILRVTSESSKRVEISVNLNRVLEGKDEDVHMRPDDILWVPTNLPKSAMIRGAQAAVEMATGVVIWRGARF